MNKKASTYVKLLSHCYSSIFFRRSLCVLSILPHFLFWARVISGSCQSLSLRRRGYYCCCRRRRRHPHFQSLVPRTPISDGKRRRRIEEAIYLAGFLDHGLGRTACLCHLRCTWRSSRSLGLGRAGYCWHFREMSRLHPCPLGCLTGQGSESVGRGSPHERNLRLRPRRACRSFC